MANFSSKASRKTIVQGITLVGTDAAGSVILALDAEGLAFLTQLVAAGAPVLKSVKQRAILRQLASDLTTLENASRAELHRQVKEVIEHPELTRLALQKRGL